MLGSYRGVVIALAGLALLGASPPQQRQDAGQAQSASAQVNQPSLPRAAVEADETPEGGEPCREGSDNRNSDLCAQWKAADAAESSANAAWLLGVAGVIIGILTLGAAIAAASYAKQAAEAGFGAIKQGEKALRQSDRTAKAELRAYVVVNDASYDFAHMKAPPVVSLRLVNVGQTPAYDVCATGVLRFAEEPPTNLRFDMRKEPRTILGRDIPINMEIVSDDDLGQPGGGRLLHAVGEIRYTDIFKQRWVQRFSLTQFGGLGSGRLTSSVRGNSEKRWRA